MFAKIELRPGLDRRGTEYQSASRFWDADLVRWHLGRMQPIGGWQAFGAALTGTARGIATWVNNNGVGRAAIGTESHLYTLTAGGTLEDRTPLSGWTAQSAESTWTLDNAGQLLVGVNDAHGTLFTWQAGEVAATALTNAPSCDSVVVTNEGIIMALGTNGNPRQIAWCDSDDFTDWTAGFADLAGDLNIQAKGGIECAANIRAGVLIWTSEDLHIARYVGLPNVYGVERVADDCGAVSRGCVVLKDDLAYWMGQSSFYICNGGAFVEEIPCELHDDVFGQINRDHIRKVRAVHNSEFNEIWWFYPKASATENSHVVVLNYSEGHWTHNELARDCGIGRGNGFDTPLMINGTTVYKHEVGTDMPGAGTPYARTGPFELGEGERILHAIRCIPDEKAAGDLDLYFYARFFPNDAEVEYGPFSAANPVNLRFPARQVGLKFQQRIANDWRAGDYRLELLGAGRR